jgi:hypothetical protein
MLCDWEKGRAGEELGKSFGFVEEGLGWWWGC